MLRTLALTLLAISVSQARASLPTDVPPTSALPPIKAELVADDYGFNEPDENYIDLVIVDDEDLAQVYDAGSDEVLFADNGVFNYFTMFRKQTVRRSSSRRSTKSTMNFRVKGCGAGRSCIAHQTGRASYYGPGFNGRKTANGEIFNKNAMTAASKSLCFGEKVRVSYRGRSVVVRINDAGPYVRGRILDLSEGAARQLGLANVDTVNISMLSCR